MVCTEMDTQIIMEGAQIKLIYPPFSTSDSPKFGCRRLSISSTLAGSLTLLERVLDGLWSRSAIKSYIATLFYRIGSLINP